jgi:hypothetical protein
MSAPRSRIFGLDKKTDAQKTGKMISHVVQPGKEFIFRMRDGREVGRAASLSEFSEKIKTIPVESLDFHAEGKHFGPWLRDMKFNVLADSVDNLASKGEEFRKDLINLFNMLL